MFVRIWRFTVPENRAERFEKAYGSDGDWARLFALADNYLGTELLRAEPGDYLTIDRWRDESDWRRFMDRHGEAYRGLDRACEDLTDSEVEIGDFTRPD